MITRHSELPLSATVGTRRARYTRITKIMIAYAFLILPVGPKVIPVP